MVSIKKGEKMVKESNVIEIGHWKYKVVDGVELHALYKDSNLDWFIVEDISSMTISRFKEIAEELFVIDEYVNVRESIKRMQPIFW
jgi:hypothetical protein